MKRDLSSVRARDILPPLATAGLLAAAFPGAGLWPLAFIGLVPLLLWAQDRQYGQAFMGGLLAGVVFHGIVFAWFAALTYWVGGIVLLGVGVLFLFFSLFWGVVVACGRLFDRWAPSASVLTFPAMWVLMEYTHNHIFTGFGWGSLGYTQWNNLSVAQLASIGSVYAVSFYIVLINVLICLLIRHIKRAAVAAPVAVAIVVFCAAVPLWGRTQMRRPDMSSSLRVGVVQPNFSLDVKWNSEYAAHMLEILGWQTELVAAKGAELVVWPESAIYGFLTDEIGEIGGIARSNDAYLLTGSNHYEDIDRGGGGKLVYYNSAFLIDPEGRKLDRYDKRHLAPFGEYVPFKDMFPFLGKIVPAMADFTGGDKMTLFTAGGKNFAVLICFENSFPHLVRRSARMGADFLVQLTNDGWFGRSSQPKQDMAIAVFRAVENGVTLVRGTNTGISCFVDPWGRISGIVRTQYGDTVFARGISVETISARAHDTFYKTHGDVWVLACAGIVAAGLGPCLYRRKKVSGPVESKDGEKTDS